MNAKKNHERLDLLTSKVLDQLASSSDVGELEALIQSDVGLRKRYSSLILQESLLHWETGQAVDYLDKEETENKVVYFPAFTSVAAALVAMFCGWLFSNNQETGKQELSQIEVLNSGIEDSKGLTNIENLARFSSSISSKVPMVLDLPLIQDPRTLSTTKHAIEMLEENVRFDSNALVSYHDQVRSWNRSDHLSVPAENGVLPYQGNAMIKLPEMLVNVDLQTAKVQETLQVLDIREISKTTGSKLDAEIFLNKGASATHDSTEFELSVHALEGGQGMNKMSTGSTSNALVADSDQSSWERLSSEFIVPQGTDFLVVSLTARMEGPHALLPNNQSNYADLLSINLTMSDGKTVGPL
tara:strand:+ start:237 stop:1304 length:1068 start_codon:yes stop_codon:yes gene_type:complete